MVSINESVKVDGITLAQLMEVKKFVELVGSTEAAKELLLIVANESNN